MMMMMMTILPKSITKLGGSQGLLCGNCDRYVAHVGSASLHGLLSQADRQVTVGTTQQSGCHYPGFQSPPRATFHQLLALTSALLRNWLVVTQRFTKNRWLLHVMCHYLHCFPFPIQHSIALCFPPYFSSPTLILLSPEPLNYDESSLMEDATNEDSGGGSEATWICGCHALTGNFMNKWCSSSEENW